jgi:hypothetical protein
MTQATISIDPKTIWRRYIFTYEVSRLRPKSPRFSTRTRTNKPAKAVHRAHSITCSAGHLYQSQGDPDRIFQLWWHGIGYHAGQRSCGERLSCQDHYHVSDIAVGRTCSVP